MNKIEQWVRSLPLVTVSIIVLNVLVAVPVFYDREGAPFAYGLIPVQVTLRTIITCNFVHDGFMHLAMNMFVFYLFGKSVERAIGRLEYLLLYLGACIAGPLVHVGIVSFAYPYIFENIPVVGASGAIAAVMGFYAVRFHRKMFHFMGLELPALFVILCWSVLQFTMGVLALHLDDVMGVFIKQVGWWSHIGGFGFGLVLAVLTNQALKGQCDYLVESAQERTAKGELFNAIEDYEALLKYKPEDPTAHMALGKLWAVQGDETRSVPHYQTAIELYVRRSEEEKALAVAEGMRKYWPKVALSVAVRYRLAVCLSETGHSSAAVKAFQKIADQNPRSLEAQMSLLHISHLQLTILSDPNTAAATLNEFLERYPHSEWNIYAKELLTQATNPQTNRA